MYIKNLIQQNIELTEKVGKMRSNILVTESKYDISGCVLGKSGEIVTGYMTDIKEYNNITEAVENIKSLDTTLYYDGTTYFVGKQVNSIMECKGKYLDISSLKFEINE